MDVRRIAEIVGTPAAIIWAAWGVWLWRKELRTYARRLYDWSLGTPEFWGLAETFWNEAAVLWFVFPILDNFYDRHNGGPALTAKQIVSIFFWVVTFFLAAVYSDKKKKSLEKSKKDTTKAGGA